MKLRFSLWMLILAALVVMTGCGPKTPQKTMVDEEPLLLLNETGEDKSELLADNSRCHVCHINYSVEKLAVTHAKADISCEQCHGPSDAHCSDEDNVTPPDIIYAEDKIQPFCMGCHTKEKIRIRTHRAFLEKPGGEEYYCTKCHGDHRLTVRTRRWDKVTRELIEDDNVRMTTDEMIKQK